jgi:hypothetical protein
MRIIMVNLQAGPRWEGRAGHVWAGAAIAPRRDIKEVRRASPVYSQTQLNSSGGTPLVQKREIDLFRIFFIFVG